MKHRIKRRKATTVTLAIACSSAGSMPGTAQAQNLDQPAAPLFELREGKLLPKQPPRMRHHVRVSYQPTFNISAEFTNLGFPSSTVPGPGAGLVDRDYDDGFVRLETTGPATGSPDGYTAYWSYENSNQVVGSDLLMRKATSSGTISSSGDIGDDPQHGVELGYAFEVGPVGRLYWGFEAAVSFIPVDIHDARPLTTDLTLITDTFDISNLDPGGGPPPPPGTPSTGRSGTSALILVEPVSRTLTPLTGSTVSGRRTVDANVFDIRIGPFIEYPISTKWSASLSGGLDLAVVDGSFDFLETLVLPGSEQLTRSGSSSRTEVLVGVYVAGRVSYAIDESWRVFGGAEYRNVGTFNHSVNGSGFRLDLGGTVLATVGVGYSF